MSEETYKIELLNYELPKRKEPYKKAFYFKMTYEMLMEFHVKRLSPQTIVLYQHLLMIAHRSSSKMIDFGPNEGRCLYGVKANRRRFILQVLENKGFVKLYS